MDEFNLVKEKFTEFCIEAFKNDLEYIGCLCMHSDVSIREESKCNFSNKRLEIYNKFFLKKESKYPYYKSVDYCIPPWYDKVVIKIIEVKKIRKSHYLVTQDLRTEMYFRYKFFVDPEKRVLMYDFCQYSFEKDKGWQQYYL